MKHILVLATFLTVGATVAYAVPACVNGDFLSNYIALGPTGCEIGDKIFANFAYTSNGTDPASTSVNVGIDDNTSLDQFGVQLGTDTTVWNSSFTLGYTVTIVQADCATLYGAGDTCSMTGAQGAFQGALAPNAAALSMSLTPGGTISLNDLTTGANVSQISLANLTSLTVAMTGTATNSSPIDSYGLDVYQTATASTPEPATLCLLGGGLLALGLVRRKRFSSR
jgi:hypothetical protein